MNINSNELLVLKRLKLNQGVNGVNPEVTGQITTPVQTQSVNKTMFRGLNDAPQTENTDSDKEYVAPYKSNLAFQGKAGKAKTYLAALMMGLATLGATSTFTSCVDVDQKAEVDMSMFSSMLSELQALRNDLAKTNEAMAEKMNQVIKLMTTLVNMYSQEQLDASAFRSQVLANQETLIELLEANGKTEAEARDGINKILDAVQNGFMSVEDGMNALKDLLVDIKGLLSQAISDLQKYADRASEERQELINVNKQGLEELIEQGKIQQETLDKMAAQNDSLITLGNKQIEAQENIKNAIEKANLDSNANFETVVKTLNADKNQLIAAMMRLGYTQNQVIRMSASEIKAAINKNTEITKQGNNLLAKITNQLTILPKLLKEGKITNAQLKEFYAAFQDAVSAEGEFNEEVLAKLDNLSAQLDAIQGSLNQILADMKDYADRASQERQELINVNKQGFEELIKQGRIQLRTLNKIAAQNDSLITLGNKQIEAQENIKEAIVQANIDSNANFETVVKTLNADKNQLIAAMVKLGYTQNQVIRMSAREIKAAINKNTEVTKQGNNLLVNISEQLSILPQIYKQGQITNKQLNKFFNLYQDATNANGEFNEEILAKLDKITDLLELIKNGNGIWTTPNFEDLMDKILANQDKNTAAIIDALGNLEVGSTGKVDLTSLEKMVAQLLDQAKKNGNILSNIDAKQTVLNATTQSILEKLEDEFGKNDERYQAIYLILNEIANKADGKNDQQLLDKLDKILAKLNDILDAIKNHEVEVTVDVTGKVNCTCTRPNEGILGDLEDILGD